MAIQNIRFQCAGTLDFQTMKAQLSSIYGIIEMNIDSNSHAVEILFDSTLTSPDKIGSRLGSDYQPQG